MAVEINHLSYKYPNSDKGLRDINIKINKNRKTAILGENGSGKSTLLYHINGMTLAQEGQIRVLGLEVNKRNLKTIQRRVGYIFDYPDHQLFSTSSYKDIEFGLDNYGYQENEKSKLINDISNKLGIEDLLDRPPFHLSLGQKKKIALAGVLVLEPDILLCDEPFSGLDNHSLAFFKDLLDEWKYKGKTIIFSTHDVDLTYQWADDLIILKDGEVISQGSVEEIMMNDHIYEDTHIQMPYLYKLFRNHKVKPRSIEEAILVMKNL